MSPRAAAAGEAGRGGRVAITVLIIAVVALVMLLVVRAAPEPGSFDPRSSRSDGASALVLLLREQGATVDVVHDAPAPGSGGRVLVLDDRLDAGPRDELLTWVRSGGVAVVADPTSPLHGGVDLPTREVRSSLPIVALDLDVDAEIDIHRGECTIDALRALRGVFVRDGVQFTVAGDAGQCFAADGFAFAITRPLGRGVVVGLGDNRLFTNELIRFADNGPLATALLAPVPGTVVHVLVGSGPSTTPSDVGSGSQTLSDLVRPGVWMALLQLGLAFVVFAIARGIRPGRPVNEPRPVPVAGSELVVATGNLMQRARHAQRAAWVIRGELYRDVCRAYGVPPTISIDALDGVAVQRSGCAPGELARALIDPVDNADQLVHAAARVATLREHILEGAASDQPVP